MIYTEESLDFTLAKDSLLFLEIKSFLSQTEKIEELFKKFQNKITLHFNSFLTKIGQNKGPQFYVFLFDGKILLK